MSRKSKSAPNLQESLRGDRVVRSAVWASWADALGFISELTDEHGLKRRLGKNGPLLTAPVEWRRRIGGKFGADAILPAGCYSDDTQLRLAVGRAVTGSGFDVEAFSKIELPVWPSYALGGGHASKGAAKNLSRPDIAWFANFYDGWTNGGGNGVAMRIQPHIWAATDPSGLGPHTSDVLINAITTHGHPRGIFGAVLHSVALGEVLATGAVPGPERWRELLSKATAAVELMHQQHEINGFWLPSWEKQVGRSFVDAWTETARECEKLLAVAADISLEPIKEAEEQSSTYHGLAESYGSLVTQLGLDGDAIRGSGTHTTIAALALSAAVGSNARAAALIAARAVGTDTDTIATMAAAVSGAADGAESAPDVLDGDYIIQEAQRLARIADGEPTERFSYPDLLSWVAPRTQSDACGLVGNRLALAGLGWCEPLSDYEPFVSRDNVWRWLKTDYGQSVLAKQRSDVRPLPEGAWPSRRFVMDMGRREPDQKSHDLVPTLFADEPTKNPRQSQRGDHVSRRSVGDNSSVTIGTAERSHTDQDDASLQLIGQSSRPRDSQGTVDELFDWVAQRRFSPESLGKALRRLAEVGTVEQVIAFSVLVYAQAQHYRRGDGITTV